MLAVEISVTDSEEVLVARIASGATISSSWRKMSFLTASDSTTASTTKSASVRSLSEVENEILPSSSACSSSVIFPRFTARPVECSRCSRPRWTASSLTSTPVTEKPLRANTSAMPAPIVPRPMTPMEPKVRAESLEVLVMGASWHALSRPCREVVHWPVTYGRPPFSLVEQVAQQPASWVEQVYRASTALREKKRKKEKGEGRRKEKKEKKKRKRREVEGKDRKKKEKRR